MYAVVTTRVHIEPFVVKFQEPPEDSGRRRAQAGRREGAFEQDARPFAHHAGDRVDGQGQRATFAEQGVCGVGEIAARVDQGAVQVEDDEFECVCRHQQWQWNVQGGSVADVSDVTAD